MKAHLIVAISGLSAILFSAAFPSAASSSTPNSLSTTRPWLDPDLPIDQRVKSLVSQLTLKEKISLMYMVAPAIARLGIDAYSHGDECLHGLVRPGRNTVYPQAIGLAATFDPDLIHAMANAISDEARARWNANNGRHIANVSDPLTLWSPVVNMARDPRWGRTQETYGEDPFLTSRMGVAFVRGLQGDDPHYIKVIATPKHFASNNQEAGRMGLNIEAGERYLQEYEFAGFRACVTEANAQSIMAAYTSINGVPSACNPWLLNHVLRDTWGFNGYVVSDCGAVSHVVDAHHYAATPEAAGADCFNNGCDLEGGWYAKYPDLVNDYLPGAVEQRLIKFGQIDADVSHVLRGRFRLGLFDPPDRVPYSRISASVIGSSEHVKLARQLADESIVLLKNDPLDAGGGALLPIDTKSIKTIAMVGPYADVAQFGDYSGNPAIAAVTPLAGITARAKTAGINVIKVPWPNDHLDPVPTDLLSTGIGKDERGLMAEYFAGNRTDTTQPALGTRTDAKVDFDWAHSAPDPMAGDKEFAVRWTGTFHADRPGSYTFALDGDGGYRFFLDHKSVIDQWSRKSDKHGVKRAAIDDLAAGDHDVKIEYRHLGGGDAQLHWEFAAPPSDEQFAPVKSADLVIAVMGMSVVQEAEGNDRRTLALSPEQQAYLKKVFALNSKTIIVLEGGSSIALDWVNQKAPAIIDAWYPGEGGGDAIAEVLFGDVNPSGRLPLTFYASDAQLRPMNEYDITKGRTYLYLPDKPLYPFGHGLSYTSFQYGNLTLSTAKATVAQPIRATVTVTNTGPRDGSEVVQCYVHAENASVPMPGKQLWAFQKVFLSKGESKTVSLDLDPKNFGHWDKAAQAFVVEPGKFDVMVGASSADIRQTATVEVKL
jgi:beta-glucosidase